MLVAGHAFLFAIVACDSSAPTPPPAVPVASCPDGDAVLPDVDPEDDVDQAFDLGVVESEPLRFCGAVEPGFDDGWLFTLANPSVITLDVPVCDCTPEWDVFDIVPVDPPAELDGRFFGDGTADLTDVPPIPMGPGVWLFRVLSAGQGSLDYVASISAMAASGPSLSEDPPSLLEDDPPLVGGLLSGWLHRSMDVRDLLEVDILESGASLVVEEWFGDRFTMVLVRDENGDGVLDTSGVTDATIQVEQVSEVGHTVTFDVAPGRYYLALFGGSGVYTIRFDERFGPGNPDL